MSLDAFLNQSCTINRPTAEVVRDRYNQNVYSDVVVGAEVRCRLVEKSVKLMDAKTSEYTWVKAKVLLLPAGTDVTLKDTATIGGVVYRIMEVLMRQRGNAAHHVSCVVEALNA
jgi:hypothetical protein